MLDSDKTLLLMIDFQEKLIKSVFKGDVALENSIKIANIAKSLNIPVVVTEQYPKGLGATDDTLKNNISGAKHFEKVSFSALLNEELKNYLLNTGKKQIILCGIELHICVLQTALDLLKNGFEVFIISDACASRKASEYNIGIELLKQYGAKIVTVEITLFGLLKTSSHEKFKQLQALIK